MDEFGEMYRRSSKNYHIAMRSHPKDGWDHAAIEFHMQITRNRLACLLREQRKFRVSARKTGFGDYTKDRHKWLDLLTVDEIVEEIRAMDNFGQRSGFYNRHFMSVSEHDNGS